MSLTTLIIIAVIFLIVSLVCFGNRLELIGGITGMLFSVSLLIILLTLLVGTVTTYDPKTEEFVIENMYYNKDGYLTHLIDDKGNAHGVYDFKRYRTVSIAEDDKISYIETTEKGVGKFLFVYYEVEKKACKIKLPKDAYYAYKYGKKADIVSAEQRP
jgi:hypothetical protein